MGVKTKKLNNQIAPDLVKLHNIFQPILRVDHHLHAKVDAYEMLMRDAKGTFPGIQFLHSLTTQKGNNNWIDISQQALDQVLVDHPQRKIYINLEPCQMEFSNVWAFLDTIYQRYHNQVAIEITERRETIHSLDYLDYEIHRLKDMGYELAIDDVCAGSNSYAFIVRQLSVIHRIKLSLLIFRNEDQETRRNFVNAWQTFALHHHLDFVIEGIANRELVQKFAGNPMVLQQGFYWGKCSANI